MPSHSMFCHVARKCYICPLSINQSMKGKGPSILDLDTKLKCNLYYLVCMSIIKLGEFKYFLIPSTFIGLKKLNLSLSVILPKQLIKTFQRNHLPVTFYSTTVLLQNKTPISSKRVVCLGTPDIHIYYS